jgi:hypothetical protein
MSKKTIAYTCLLTSIVGIAGFAMVQHKLTGPTAAIPRNLYIYSAKQRKLQQACQRLVVPYDPMCPRVLSYGLTSDAGFGHQLTELLFALRKAHIYGLSLVFESFGTSTLHKDNYTGMDELLGLGHIFSGVIGTDWSQIKQIMAEQNASWQTLDTSISPHRSKIGCGSFMTSRGYQNCPSGRNNDCFRAPENAFLFEDAKECLRTATREFGLAGSNCIFTKADESVGRKLPNDTVYVVWHIRLGDMTLHHPSDNFYQLFLTELKQVIVDYKSRLFLVGKRGTDNTGVFSEYVDMIRKSVGRIWNDTSPQCVPDVIAPVYSFTDAFLAMMQADLLVGSGSSLPAVASLVSEIPLFFNHVPKHGYNHGAEMTADSVDMESNGEVLESHRRLRVDLHRRMHASRRTACR